MQRHGAYPISAFGLYGCARMFDSCRPRGLPETVPAFFVGPALRFVEMAHDLNSAFEFGMPRFDFQLLDNCGCLELLLFGHSLPF
jgi:hypothetical protein